MSSVAGSDSCVNKPHQSHYSAQSQLHLKSSVTEVNRVKDADIGAL